MTMAYEIKKAAYESDLKARAINVLSYLCDRSDNNTLTCFPSLKTISKCLHIGVTTVKRALADLIDAGFVKKDPRFSARKNGAQTSNLYTLAIPKKKQKIKATTAEPVEEKLPTTVNIPEILIAQEVEFEYVPQYYSFEDMVAEYHSNHPVALEKTTSTVTEKKIVIQEKAATEIQSRGEAVMPVNHRTTFNVENGSCSTEKSLEQSKVAPIPQPVPTVPEEQEKPLLSKLNQQVQTAGNIVKNAVQKRKWEEIPSFSEQIKTLFEDDTIRSYKELSMELEWGNDRE